MVMTPTKPPVLVHHRRRDQVILVEGIGHLVLVLRRRDHAETVLGDLRQRRLARRRQEPAQRDVARGLQARIGQDHVVELLGQVGLVGAQVVDHLAHGPVLGRVHDLALHQAPGGFLRIGQRLLHRRPVPVVEPLEDRGRLLVLEVLEDVHEVVGIELAHRLHDLLGRQELDDLLAQAPVQLRQDLAVDPPRPERQPRRPLARR
jgi:hypothetical protein